MLVQIKNEKSRKVCVEESIWKEWLRKEWLRKYTKQLWRVKQLERENREKGRMRWKWNGQVEILLAKQKGVRKGAYKESMYDGRFYSVNSSTSIKKKIQHTPLWERCGRNENKFYMRSVSKVLKLFYKFFQLLKICIYIPF